jgi:hypothetical protein
MQLALSRHTCRNFLEKSAGHSHDATFKKVEAPPCAWPSTTQIFGLVQLHEECCVYERHAKWWIFVRIATSRKEGYSVALYLAWLGSHGFTWAKFYWDWRFWRPQVDMLESSWDDFLYLLSDTLLIALLAVVEWSMSSEARQCFEQRCAPLHQWLVLNVNKKSIAIPLLLFSLFSGLDTRYTTDAYAEKS